MLLLGGAPLPAPVPIPIPAPGSARLKLDMVTVATAVRCLRARELQSPCHGPEWKERKLLTQVKPDLSWFR
jgi:hypothetical protein